MVDQIIYFKKESQSELTEKIRSMEVWNPEFM